MKGDKHTGKYCHSCGQELTSWDMRCSKALAYHSPVCEQCIAKEYDLAVEEVRGVLEDFYGMRPCMGT